jgi:hypothetical protein
MVLCHTDVNGMGAPFRWPASGEALEHLALRVRRPAQRPAVEQHPGADSRVAGEAPLGAAIAAADPKAELMAVELLPAEALRFASG